MSVTASLCPTCYREIPAKLDIVDGALWMTKTCPEHGETRAMAERDALFWRMCQQGDGFAREVYGQMSLIEVTDRCNLACRHCYHQPDNHAADRPLDWIVAKAIAAPTERVCLMGAEPTMRDDLPELVAAIRHAGKLPLIYTNGIRLADAGRVAALKEAGLDGLSLSVHDTAYHNDKVAAKVAQAVANVMAAGLPIGQLSFTITDLDDSLRNTLARILDLAAMGANPVDFCLRSPAAIGQTFDGPEFFISDMVKAMGRLALEQDLHFTVAENSGNNPYHVRTLFCGAPIQIIHWPTVANIDIRFMGMGPWASFIDGTFGSFALQAIQRDGLKQGWWQGRRLS